MIVSMKSWQVMGEVLCREIAFGCLEVVLAKSRGSVAWVMYCSRPQRGGESWQYMGEGFAGSWGAKSMKNRNKTKRSKWKREEVQCFRGPRCRFGAFVTGRDVAVRSMPVFSLFCTEAAAQSSSLS